MAIPHFGFQGISKGKGQNIIASASYMARKKMIDQQEADLNKKIKKSFSTTKDHHLTMMMLPDRAPIEYQDPETCWNDLNAVEKDRLAVRFLLPLPKELTKEQGIELAKEWAYQEFVSKGHVVQLSFHEEKDKNGNFHCHGLGSYRQLVNGEWAKVKSHKVYVDENNEPLKKTDKTPKLKNGKLQYDSQNNIIFTNGWQELVYDKNKNPILNEDGTPVLKDIRTPLLNPDGTQKTTNNGEKYKKLAWKERKITMSDLERREAAAEARKLWEKCINQSFEKHNILDEQGNILQVDLRSYEEQDKNKPEEEKRIPTRHQGIGPAADMIKEENQKEMQRRKDIARRKELKKKVTTKDKVISYYVENEIQPENLFVYNQMQPLHESHNYKNEKCDTAYNVALIGYNETGKDIAALQEKENLTEREQAKLDFLQQNRISWFKTLNKISKIRNYNGTAELEMHCRNQWKKLTGWQRYKYVSSHNKRKAEIYKAYLIRHEQFDTEHQEQKLPETVTLNNALTSITNESSAPSINAKINKSQPVIPQFDRIAASTFKEWKTNAESELHLPPTKDQLEVLTVLENTPERLTQLASGIKNLTYRTSVPLEYTAEQDHQQYIKRIRSIEEAEFKEKQQAEAERLAKEAEAKAAAEQKAEAERIREATSPYTKERIRLNQIQINNLEKLLDKIITPMANKICKQRQEERKQAIFSGKVTPAPDLEQIKKELRTKFVDKNDKPTYVRVVTAAQRMKLDTSAAIATKDAIKANYNNWHDENGNLLDVPKNAQAEANQSNTTTKPTQNDLPIEIQHPTVKRSKSKLDNVAFEQQEDGSYKDVSITIRWNEKDNHDKNEMEKAEEAMTEGWDPWKNR